jgi:hypothetical protein
MKHPPSFLPVFLSLLPLIAQAVPTNVALNQPAEADSLYSPAYPASNAVDGNSADDTSRWMSGTGAYPHWIEIDLEESHQLSRMVFRTGKNGIGPFPLYDFALQYWDGATWTDLHSETGSTNTGDVDVSFGPVLSGNRIRLHVTDGEDSIVRLFELEVYGEPHGLTYDTQFPANGGTLFDPAADITVAFDAPLAAGSLSGVRIENLTTATDVPGASASVSGSDLVISHGGLDTSGSYAVHVPEGVVLLAADATTPNGALYWEFATAPLIPQLAEYTAELPGLTGPVELTFDRDIGLIDGSGIKVERFSDGAAVGGIGLATAGATLSISHDPLVAEESYIVAVPSGAIEGLINSEPNEEIRLLVHAGSTTLFETDFDTGLEGFNTAHLLGETSGTSSNIYWKWTNSGIGPDYDSAYLRSDTNYSDDFVVSPQVELTAGRTYILEFRAQLARALHVGVTPTASLADVEEIALVSAGGPKSVRLEFVASSSGPQYLIFFSGETNWWQDQAIDAFLFTESVPPAVRINTPADGSSHLESDAIPVEIEAYGIAGDIVSVELFDNGVSMGTLSRAGAVYPYDWNYHGPGTHVLRVEATDSRGNVSTEELTVTVTFDDGTLPDFIGYDFDDGKEGWKFFVSGTEYLSGTAIKVLSSGTRQPGNEVVFNSKGSNGLAISSPTVFLLAGETYTFQFDGQFSATSPAWGFLPTTTPGYPADTTGKTTISPTTTSWNRYSCAFTVPANGAYHLTLFAPLSGYWGARIDDIRLIGNFNSAPQVILTNPPATVTTFSGATINLSANASDADGVVTLVEFIDADTGQLLEPGASDTSAPWEFDWITSTPGTYEVAAAATDDTLGISQSASRSVTVAPNNLSISTYLGGADTDENLTGAAYLGDGTLVLGGILDPDLFPGVTPVYLNGSAPGDRGIVARLSEDGTTVLSVTVVGARVTDIDTDDGTRIFVAAMEDGAVVLNATANTVLWAQDYAPACAHRIDAAEGGTYAVLTSSQWDYRDSRVHTGSNYIYDTHYLPLGTTGGTPQYTTDLAVDESSQTVVFTGFKNIHTSGNPVDVPGLYGRGYDNAIKWRGYDWGKEDEGTRWLNYYTNNMADTRGARVIVHEGKVYAGIEFDGGNTPLRYDPFDLAVTAPVVGGDAYHSMFNTSTVPKTFIGIYEAATGAYRTGQWITNRLPDGSDNTIRIEHGNIMVDNAGRIHVVGSSAAGLPMTHDPFPGAYSGGGFHLVYSPDFESREFMTRLSIKGDNAAIALSPNGKIAIAGKTENALFLTNALQGTLINVHDAYFAVGDYDTYYNFQTGIHPRLFFNATQLDAIRARLGHEPYAAMYANLVAKRDYANFYRYYDPSDPGALFSRAQGSAFLYALSGDETYATDARDDIQTALGLIDPDWASASEKGLTLYSHATELAMAYDLCANSDAWDAAFNYQASKRLVEIAEVIVNDGGTGQPSSLGSNWKAARGASAGLAYLATDHAFNQSLADAAEGFVQNYLNTNQAPGAVGWNPEGFGYTAYAVGNFVGPYGVAADRAAGGSAYQNNARLEGLTWSGFAGATTAYDIFGLGGVKTDWSDDNPHTGGEGTYGLAFYYADADLKRGIRHAYDRFMGALSPFGPDWDGVQQGSFWSILFYPESVRAQDPTEIWDWHRRSAEFGGTGTFTFRNAYADADDILVQFKAKIDDIGQAHDGPDGLGFRLIGLDDAFVVGGGRNSPGLELNQATVYPQNPDIDFAWKKKTGSLVGTPLIKPDGAGHVIAAMGENNVGTFSHKRWFVTDFDTAETGAAATIIVADTSANGLYWQLPTFLKNTITHSGDSFTITGTGGATLRGTILHPGGTPAVTVGVKARGSHYGLEHGGTLATEDPVANPRIEENRTLHIQGDGDGAFLVVLTLVDSAGSHPAVTHVSGGVADAVVKVGNKNFALQPDDVLYSTGADTPVAYNAPGATVTFDADGKGTLGGAAVQSVAYGGSAIAPVVSPISGYTFMDWDKSFAQVVKSMTVTALYDASGASGFAAWIGDPLYGLAPADQNPGDNPDNDLYVNLVEYALVLNPSLPDGAGAVSIREESGSLILSYRVRDGAADITVTPKYAADLSGTWTDIPGANISPTGSGPGYTGYEASMPIGTGPLFLMLEVSQ